MRGHDEIFRTVRHEILAGKYDADKRFPSESALAERFGCSRPTISRVTLDLKREGLIVTRKGAPSMVTRYALNATGALGLVVPGESYTEIFKPIISSLPTRSARANLFFSSLCRLLTFMTFPKIARQTCVILDFPSPPSPIRNSMDWPLVQGIRQ